MKLKSNLPFWLIKNGLINSYTSLQEDTSCEVLIVGSGVTGSLIAHQCIKDGYDTLLIDKRKIGFGSTSATTSLLQYEIDVPLVELSTRIGKQAAQACYLACSKSIDTLHSIAKEVKSKSGFKRKKSIYFAAYKKDVKDLKKEYHARKEAGFAVDWMQEEEIRQRFDLHKAYGGILSTQGASMDAYMFTHELLHFNSKKGLRVYDNTEFLTVQDKKGYSEVALGTGAKVRAKKIIYCVGYESTAMIKEDFVNLISTYASVSEINPAAYKPYSELLIWNTASPYLYLRTTDDGRFLIGGEDEPFGDANERDRRIARKQRKLKSQFRKHFPNLDFYPDMTWAGTFGETKDGLPYIGEHSRFKNSYFVLGFGGNGITFSAVGMDMVSFWLKNQKHPLTERFAFGR